MKLTYVTVLILAKRLVQTCVIHLCVRSGIDSLLTPCVFACVKIGLPYCLKAEILVVPPHLFCTSNFVPPAPSTVRKLVKIKQTESQIKAKQVSFRLTPEKEKSVSDDVIGQEKFNLRMVSSSITCIGQARF